MLKREWGAGSNRKLPHLFIPSKTATLVPEFAMEDLSLGRSAAFVPEFAVKDLPLDRTQDDDDDDDDGQNFHLLFTQIFHQFNGDSIYSS